MVKKNMMCKRMKNNKPLSILIISFAILLATKLLDFQFSLLLDLSLNTLAIVGLFIGGVWFALEYFKVI